MVGNMHGEDMPSTNIIGEGNKNEYYSDKTYSKPQLGGILGLNSYFMTDDRR